METPQNENQTQPPGPPEPALPAQSSTEGYQPLSAVFTPETPNRKLKWLVAALLFVVVAAGIFFYLKSKDKTVSSTAASAKVTNASKESSQFTSVKQANGDVKVSDRTWFSKPISKPLSGYTVFPMSVLRCEQGCEPKFDNYTFWQVGKTDGGQEIILADSLTVAGGPFLFLSKNGKNILLKKQSPDIFSTQNGKLIYDSYGPNTVEDGSTTYPELNAPQRLTLKGKKFSLKSKYGTPLLDTDSTKAFSVYASTDYGPVSSESRSTASDSSSTYSARRYVLKMYDFRPTYYQPDPVVDNIKEGDISFSDGTTNKQGYSDGFHGCSLGGSYYDIILDKNATFSQAATFGTVQLYTIDIQADAAILKDTYDAYQTFAKDANDSSYPTMTFNMFLQKRPILFFKNSLGEYTALYSDDAVTGGGCGKPAVYLYPEKAQNVTVKVDVDIRISRPNYEDGWKIYAKPSEQLTLNGKQYDSLYWEGLGRYYPFVTGGTIVARA